MDKTPQEMAGNAPYSDEAKAFVAKVYPCEPPCDSYGICSNCASEGDFGAGYNMGYRAGLAEGERRALGKICEQCGRAAYMAQSLLPERGPGEKG